MIFLIVLIVVIFVLQIYLSKNENKWLGLILPFISFIISIVPIILYFISIISSGEVLKGTDILDLTLSFLITNIPTLILLVIYLVCRKNMKKNKQLEKMCIKDL